MSDKEITWGQMRKGLLNNRSGMEADVAQSHGKERGYGIATSALKNTTGLGRKVGRAMLEGSGLGILAGVAGRVAGEAIGGQKYGRLVGMNTSRIGRTLGDIHGYVKSTENQAREAHEKYAALEDLVINQGIDFDRAAELVKEASIAGMLTRAKRVVGVGAAKVGKAVGNAAADFKGDLGTIRNAGTFSAATGGRVSANQLRMHGAKQLAKNPLTIGAAGVAGAAGATALGAHLGQQKQAAVDMLMQGHGLDFDSAVDLVNAKAQELYGD